MNTRLKQLSSETRALQRKHQEVLPKNVKPIAFTLNDPSCEDKLGNVTIQTSVPNITTKAEQTTIVKKNTDNEHARRKVPF
jgi:hypothetical protein